jgi:hypothetical protein
VARVVAAALAASPVDEDTVPQEGDGARIPQVSHRPPVTKGKNDTGECHGRRSTCNSTSR